MAITFSDLVDYEVVKSAPYVVRYYDEETGFYTTLFDNDEQSIAEVEGGSWYSEAEVFEIYVEDPNVYDPSLASAHDPRVVIELDCDYFL